MPQLTRISEIALVDFLKKQFAPKKSSVIQGIGDDAAVVRMNRTTAGLFTSDMLVENVHFRANDDFFWVGSKAINCSLSDIAAMGGVPRYALVSLGIPKDISARKLQRFAAGCKKAAQKYDVAIIGGDTIRAHKVTIDVMVYGEAKAKKVTYRSAARTGDHIFVTGQLGGSRYERHLRFTPRVHEAQFLLRNFAVHAMIDVSDGLLLDMGRILRASSVGAVLFENCIPVSSQAKKSQEALSMGEDYELLFTMPPTDGQRLLSRIQKKTIPCSMSFIGKVIAQRNALFLVNRRNKVVSVTPKGFQHF